MTSNRKRLIDYIKNKGNKKGFSLAEALVAILIMLMVSSVVAAGIPAATRAYDNVVMASNAETLLSTTVSTLRNELGTAAEVVVAADGQSVTYYNTSKKKYAKISVSDTTEHEYEIMYSQSEVSDDGSLGYGSEESLISEQVSTDKLYITCESIAKSNNIISFNNLQVKRTSNDNSIRTGRNLSVRLISE